MDGESLDVADLIALGVITGEWPAFERAVALGLALERDHPDAVSGDEVRREATAFRYEHGLISAADFRTWLEARALSVGDLIFCRLVLPDRGSARPAVVLLITLL